MEKRLFLAIILSILVLMTYSALVARLGPQQPPQQYSQQPIQPPSTDSASFQAQANVGLPSLPIPTIEPLPAVEKLYGFTNSELNLSINLFGSWIRASTLNFYNTNLLQSDIGLLAEWQDKEFTKINATDYTSTSYNDTANGVEVIKSYRFTKDQYIIEMNVEFVNTSGINKYMKYNFNLGSIDEEIRRKNPAEERYIELFISLQDKVLRGNFFRFNTRSVNDKIQWLGIRDRYFCSIVKPMQEVGSINKSVSSGTVSYLLEFPVFELLPGQRIKHSYLLYIGPQQTELVSRIGNGAEQSINFGMFDAIAHMLLGALRLLYNVSKNWGVAVILFSLLVFIVLSPLSIKSFSSMKKMQEVQPIIEELKIKHKDNQQRMHKEILELYREKRINPFGGCLPLLLQMPIFIALYQALMRFIELKGAGFLWIKDLAEPDRLFVFKQSFPIIGNELNLLPLIMIATMLIQQKMTAVSALQTSETAKQQKLMSLFMSVFFGIIFYHMPAGLVLYWAFNSILMLLFQARILRAKA